MSKNAPQMPPVPPPPPPTPVKAIKPEKTVKMQTQKKMADPNKVGPKQTVLTGPQGLGTGTTTGKGLLSGQSDS
tara:strand:+ start:1473 stop:1694 length:222 start_codon:yes stop_codon:yes gene_type:complete